MKKNNYLKIILCSGLLLFAISSHSQITADLIKKYDSLNPESLNPQDVKKAKPFWEAILFLRNHEIKQSQFNSTVRFGLNGDEAEDRSIYVANAGLNFKKGFYPGQLSVSSSVRVRLDNNVFRENVSNLRMTYDYNFTQETESYIYLDRFTDNFMNIDQRYELGGGIILPIFGGLSDDNLVGDGNQIIQNLNQIDFDTSSVFSDAEWYEVWENQTKKEKENWDESDRKQLISSTKNDLATLRKSWKNARATTIKTYAKWRTALLLGVTSETEIAKLSGTLTKIDGEEQLFEEQANKHTWRWTVRPTVDIQPNPFLKIKFRPYFKLPMPWEWQEKVNLGEQSDNRMDWRMDLQSSLTIFFPTKLWNQNRIISFSFSYQYLKDFSPPRLFLNDLGSNGKHLFLEARSIHHAVSMTFQVSFN